DVPTVEQLSSLKLKELKERCKSYCLPVTGSKKELVQRLRNHLVTRADEESLLLSEDALAENSATAASVSLATSGEERSELDEDSKISVPPSPPPPEPKVPGSQLEAAKVTNAATPTPAAPASQSELGKETKISKPAPTDPVSQSEPTKETEKATTTPTDPSDSQSVDVAAIEIDSEASMGASKSEEAEAAAPQPLEGVLRAPMKAAGLAELTEDERRQLRAKRFGVDPAAPASSSSADTTHPEIESRKRARAQRFGDASDYASPKPAGARGSRQSDGASLAPGDVDKMRKRAERFGVVTSPALMKEPEGLTAADKDVDNEDSEEVAAKKRARAARFGGDDSGAAEAEAVPVEKPAEEGAAAT
ncbi:hypothetical protein BOX15_Mlig011318g1, partial [Macrostomum lignano]